MHRLLPAFSTSLCAATAFDAGDNNSIAAIQLFEHIRNLAITLGAEFGGFKIGELLLVDRH